MIFFYRCKTSQILKKLKLLFFFKEYGNLKKDTVKKVEPICEN